MDDFFQVLTEHKFVFSLFCFLEIFLLLILGGVIFYLRAKIAKAEKEKKETENELTKEVNFCLVPLGKERTFVAQIEITIHRGKLKKFKIIPQTTRLSGTN